MFGHYRVLASIDAGAGVEMYHADDPDTGAQFLIRVVTHGAGGAARKPPRALQHSNILSTVEAGDFDGCAYVALEFVAGHTLAVEMRRTVSPPPEVLKAGTGIAKGLEHAHSQGVPHGDVRPVNVWLADNGDFKLMWLESASAGLVADYQSPEQTRGETPDARSDIFSLGVVLYEMATGRRPFRGKTPEETIRQIQTAEPDMISRWSPVAPKELVAAIHRCLAKNPEDRFGSATELLQALTQCKLTLPAERRWIKWAAAVLVAVLAVLGYFFLRPASVAPAGSLAVLAFEPAAGDPLSDLASDMASEIADAFSARPGLRVVAQRSSFRFTSKAGTEKQAGTGLEVDTVLSGQLSGSPTLPSLHLRIFDARSGSQIWTKTVETGSGGLPALVEEVVIEASGKIGLLLTEDERAALRRRLSKSGEAYQLYLRGRRLRRARGLSAQQQAVDVLQQAVAVDPSFSLAHASLADAYADPVFRGQENRAKATAAALKALALNENLPEAHAALARIRFMLDWNWPDAQREFRRAIPGRLPGGDLHSAYALYLAAMGRLAEARSTIQEAEQRDPHSAPVVAALSWIFYLSRRKDEAILQGRRAVGLTPPYEGAYWVQGHNLISAGQFQEAVDLIAKSGVLVPDAREAPAILGMLGCAYASAGHPPGVQEMVSQLNAMSVTRHVSAYHLALVHGCSGDLPNALAALERAYEERSHWLPFARIEPAFNVIALNSRFEDLMKKIGLIETR